MPIPAIMAAIAALSAIGSAGSGIAANSTNKQLVREQNAWQTAENEKSYQRGLEMMNLTNAYNSPTAQMSRLTEAGLNPNLVYGNGSATTQSISPPDYKPADIKRATIQPYTGYVEGMTNAVNVAMQSKLNSAQVDKLNAEADTERLRQSNIALTNARSDFELGKARELREYAIDNVIQDNWLKRMRVGLTEGQSEAQHFENQILRDTMNNRVKLSDNQVKQAALALERAQIDLDFVKFENSLKEVGIYPGDAIYLRIAAILTQSLMGDEMLGSIPALGNLFNPKK